MIRYLFVSVLTSFVINATAQQDQGFLHNKALMERIPNLGTSNSVVLGSMAISTPGLVGDVYLNLDYRASTFWLYDENKIAHDLKARLDIQRNEFDVIYGKEIRALSGSRVRTLAWIDSLTHTPQYFVNGKEYTDDEGTPYLGFFQILSEGEITFLKMTRVIFKPADKNPTHSTGSRDDRFLKRTELYYAIGAKALELPNRKGTQKLFDSRKAEIEKFIKVNAIDLSKESHLTALFNYYNSLVKK